MYHLVIKAGSLQDIRTSYGDITGEAVVAAEQFGTAAFLARAQAGICTAVVLNLTPLAYALTSGETHVATVYHEDENPEPVQVSAAFLRCLTPRGLLSKSGEWRQRTARWEEQLRRSLQGEYLLGVYPDAPGSVGYNEIGKRAFEQDARRYLRAVQHHLGYGGKVNFNPVGMAVSGDASLRAQTPSGELQVCISASGLPLRGFTASPSGTFLYWGFSQQPRWQGAHWDTSGSDLARQIRAKIQPLDQTG